LAGSGPPFATAESVAQVIRFLVSPAAGQVTGVELPVDAGYVL
jgi:NAD(P)-dependent dehydrogenase (short-subunit alcohol dehydrogenase family)